MRHQFADKVSLVTAITVAGDRALAVDGGLLVRLHPGDGDPDSERRTTGTRKAEGADAREASAPSDLRA
ncbi:hypothetical protein [Streptomyces sp. NPDC098781]|uniref:hypothetical protein n=1 Tax=Streptomyces sp. NPDC098781 TaxID=3366097 RepID=UPI00381D316F